MKFGVELRYLNVEWSGGNLNEKDSLEKVEDRFVLELLNLAM